jgi:NAD(P)H-nitrite reductase large subunit
MMDKDLICKCRHVSENDIRKALENGVNSYSELQDVTRASTGCNKCYAKVMQAFGKYKIELRTKKAKKD